MLKVNKHLSAESVAHIGGLDVFHYGDLNSIETDWRAFETAAHATIFQSFDWCQLWLQICAANSNLTPMIVIARNPGASIAFILPFQIRRIWGVSVLEWIGHGDFTYGGGLYSGAMMDGAWLALHGAAVLATLEQVKVLNLRNMPQNIFDRPSPIEFLHTSLAANPSFQTTLKPDFKSLFHDMRSAKSINSIQRRDKRLEALGELHFEYVTELDEAQHAVEVGLKNKAEQLAEAGVGLVFNDNDVQFYKATLKANLQVFRLRLNGQTLSTILGALYKGRFTLLIPSLAASAVQVHSPGDYLLRKSIAFCCSNDTQVYDFGEGEQAYKLSWADRRIELYNNISTKGFIGLPLALLMRLQQSMKRRVKAAPFMRENLYRARRFLFGKKRYR